MRGQWREIARACKRVALGNGRIRVLDREFTVAYDARGAWQENDYPILQRLATTHRCIWDVGAHKGITALIMATAMPAGRLYAIEASEYAANIIRANASLNGLTDRIEVVNALVDERSGATMDFYWDSASVYASVLPNREEPGRRVEPLRKATLSLDDFASAPDRSPDFVKIDVEGAEGRVLRGMQNTLRHARPLAFVEVHRLSDKSVGDHAVSLLPFVQAVGYRMIALRTKREVTDAESLAGYASRVHVLLLPVERQLPEGLTSLDTSSL